MATVLTSHLTRGGHRVRACDEWTVAELQTLQRQLFNMSEKALLAVYDEVGDNRRQRFETLAELEAHWAKLDIATHTVQELANVRRDGLCHEAVMWAVHHVP